MWLHFHFHSLFDSCKDKCFVAYLDFTVRLSFTRYLLGCVQTIVMMPVSKMSSVYHRSLVKVYPMLVYLFTRHDRKKFR